MTYWKMRDCRTNLFSTGGIAAHFDATGRTFVNKIGVKGSIFHHVYGFSVDADGVRRLKFGDSSTEVDVVPGRELFTRNQLLNKQDRILDDLSPTELAKENRKQF